MTPDELRAAGANAVVYSEKAWAAARRSSQAPRHDRWFPDCGAHSSRYGLTSDELASWADDWTLMVPEAVSHD